MTQQPHLTHSPATAPTDRRSDASWLVNARVAGAIYAVIIVVGIVSEVALRSRLVVAGDPAATAANLRDSGWLLRLVFAANLGYVLAETAAVVILYLLLRSVSRPVALAAAAFRLASLAIYGLNLLNLLAALRVLEEPGEGSALGSGQREALALLFVALHQLGYAIGLTFFAVNCVFMGYLLVGSSHAPTPLGVLLAVAGVGYLISSYLFFVVPGYDGSLVPLLLAPAFVAETWLCVFLLRKGGGVREWNEAAAPGPVSAAVSGRSG